MHADNFTRLDNVYIKTLDIVVCQFLLNRCFLPNQHNRHLPLPGSHNGTSDFIHRGAITAHGINGNYRTTIQKKQPILPC